MNIQVSITNFQGQEIRVMQYRYLDSPPVISDLQWDGRDAWGNKLSQGIYIYKIQVQSRFDNAKATSYQRLVIQ